VPGTNVIQNCLYTWCFPSSLNEVSLYCRNLDSGMVMTNDDISIINYSNGNDCSICSREEKDDHGL